MHQWYKPLFYFDQLEVDYSSGYEIEMKVKLKREMEIEYLILQLIFVALD